MEKSNHNLPLSAPIQKKMVFNARQKIVLTISSALIVLVLIVSIYTLLLWPECKCRMTNGGGIPKNVSSYQLLIKSRSDWHALSPKEALLELSLPASRVIIAHTATGNCSTAAACSLRARSMQTYHVNSHGWDDIAYNFLVGGDGSILEGRGWNKTGACVKGFNIDSVCIGFIGTFTDVAPTPQQLASTQQLLYTGVELNKLKTNYRLYGSRQLTATESPGEQLYIIIKTWEHWTASKYKK